MFAVRVGQPSCGSCAPYCTRVFFVSLPPPPNPIAFGGTGRTKGAKLPFTYHECVTIHDGDKRPNNVIRSRHRGADTAACHRHGTGMQYRYRHRWVLYIIAIAQVPGHVL